MANENINQVNFSSKTKEELSLINSGKSENKSLGAKKRWLKEKSQEIVLLMNFYKSGNQLEVMEKYVSDNERFMELYKKAESIEEKRRILRDYQFFQLKIYELMFGSKSCNANLNINKNEIVADVVLSRLREWKSKGN